MGSVQLGFGRGFVRSCQWSSTQCGVGQSADNTFFTVNHYRFAAVRCVFTDGHFLGQAEVDRFACTACGNDVLVFACVLDCIAQVHFFRRPVVRNDVQTFGQLFTNLVQCVLNGVYRCTRRTVGMIDGKVGLCDRTIRTNSRIQRCCQRFDLADVHSVGVFRTFGYVGNLVAAVVQTRLGQGYGIGSIGNGQTVVAQYAVARGDLRCVQSVCSQYAVADCHFVERYIVRSFNCQVFAAAFHTDILTLFHGHGVARSDFFAFTVGFFVRFQLPTFLGSLFY